MKVRVTCHVWFFDQSHTAQQTTMPVVRAKARLRKNVGAPATAGKIGTLTPDTQSANIAPPNLLQSKDVAVDEIEQEPVDRNDEHDPWCSGCSNGGVLVNCSFCRCRAACDACVEFPPPATLRGTDFMCPVCHLARRQEEPYFVSFLMFLICFDYARLNLAGFLER